MTSRERVRRVLEHRLPDMLPNGWGGCETAGMHVCAYQRLREVLALPPAAAKVDTFMFNAVFEQDTIDAMGGDVLLVASPNMCARPLRASEGWKAHTLFGMPLLLTDDQQVEHGEDGSTYLLRGGRRYARCPAGGLYFDSLPSHGLFDEVDMPRPEDIQYGEGLNDEALRQLEYVTREAYEGTDYSLCMGESVPDLQLTPGGMVNWYDAMLNEPEMAGEFLDRAVEASLKALVRLHQAVGKYCDMLSIAHDLGDARCVSIGAGLFRKIYKPRYKRLFEGWHRITGMKVNLHSCGSIAEILPDLIECGVDVYNPVQRSAAGMEIEALKAMAGDRLVFYGGAYDAILTPPGTDPEEVYHQARRAIEVLGRGGGYLFAGVHNSAADTPRSHIEAVLRAYRDARSMYAPRP